MTLTEMEAIEYSKKESNKKGPSKKRRVRPIPLTSKIPLYDKLLAEKEERYFLFLKFIWIKKQNILS